MTEEVQYRFGIPEPLRNETASLYDEAFAAKLSVAVPNKEQRLLLLADFLLLLFSLYQRQLQESELLMDGIAVRQGMRVKGVGSTLLEELKQYARKNGYSRIRLDVVDTNPAARRLYERQGFVTTRIEHFDNLRGLLGFGASATMVFQIE